MHLKRLNSPKSWPIERKKSKYVVKSLSHKNLGIPLIILLRNVLNLTQNKKETKKTIYESNILINGKVAKEEKNTVMLFDTISIIPLKKYYRLILSEKGKFIVKEITEKESHFKVSKIVNKTILKGGKTQLNLIDGRNYITSISCKCGDSILINLKENKIEKCLPFKEKSNVFAFKGKHSGKEGIIETINFEKKITEILTKNKEKMNVLTKYLIVTE